MIDVDEAVRRAIEGDSMLYTRKQTVPDDRRDDQLRFLYELAEMAPPGPAVECGVYRGGSLLCWTCARLGRGQLWAVDDWSTSRGRDDFYANLARYQLDVQVVSEKAHDAAGKFDDDSVAFCFIDADHKDGICDDIQAWPEKIMSGGIITFHDYNVQNVDVRVKEMVDIWHAEAGWTRINGVVSSLIGFKRPLG